MIDLFEAALRAAALNFELKNNFYLFSFNLYLLIDHLSAVTDIYTTWQF